MTQIIISIVTFYLLYYAGNIIYDLFLKKDIFKKQDETEEYSLTEFVEKIPNETKEITIDDVENIKTPNSFSIKEFSQVIEEELDENRNLDYWRNKFESEKDIDSFDEISDSEDLEEISMTEQIETDQKPETQHQSYEKQFYQFLNLAETSIQVLSDYDGYKVYQSII